MKSEKITKIVLSLALLAGPVLMMATSSAEAAKLSTVSDVISDSGLSAESDHVITFKATSGLAASDTVVYTFDSAGQNFDLSGVSDTDLTLAAGTCGSESAVTLGAAPSLADWGAVVNSTADTITLTLGTAPVAADDCVVLTAAGTNTINNPASAAIYDLNIATTSDTGLTKLAILDHVTADVTIDETLSFAVAGQTTGSCVTTTDVATTATSISYGSVSADTFYQACQELTVSTNASGGYSVTVQQDQDLTSAALDTIAAGTCDGGCAVATQAAWATATNNGFGYCVDDVTGTDGVMSVGCTVGATATYRTLGTLGTDTPEVVMSNTGVVSNNATELNYKISIDGAQEAGTYSNDIVYVATPTY